MVYVDKTLIMNMLYHVKKDDISLLGITNYVTSLQICYTFMSNNVWIEPSLLLLSESLSEITANIQDNAQVDLRVRGFCITGQKVFLR